MSILQRVYDAFYPAPAAPLALTPADPAGSVHQNRADSWLNPWTGLGTARDKTMAGFFAPSYQLSWTELIAIFNGNDLARKIVEKPVTEMFRRGYDLQADDVDPDEQKDLQKKLADLRVDYQLMWAMIWGRLFGGALVILGAIDGQLPDQPLNEENISSFEYLNVVDRRYVWVQSYYSDPLSPKYGTPELYMITNVISGGGLLANSPRMATVVIHESRVIRFDGNETDAITRQQLAGWSFSVLQTVYDVLKKFEHGFDSAGALLSDASQAVFKLKGLIEAIGDGDKENLQARMAAVEMGRSTIKAVLLDADGGEEFDRKTTSFAGISDVLDKQMSRLCAAADMPRSELFGESPGGLNANANGETRKWYDQIASKQTGRLAPALLRVVSLVSKAADSPVSTEADWHVKFHPLWLPSDLENGQYRLAVAQADNIYLTAGVVTPEQVALGRFGGEFSPDVEVNTEDLQAAIDGKKMSDPYENEPPPPDPAIQPPGGAPGPPQTTGPKPPGGARQGRIPRP